MQDKQERIKTNHEVSWNFKVGDLFVAVLRHHPFQQRGRQKVKSDFVKHNPAWLIYANDLPVGSMTEDKNARFSTWHLAGCMCKMWELYRGQKVEKPCFQRVLIFSLVSPHLFFLTLFDGWPSEREHRQTNPCLLVPTHDILLTWCNLTASKPPFVFSPQTPLGY